MFFIEGTVIQVNVYRPAVALLVTFNGYRLRHFSKPWPRPHFSLLGIVQLLSRQGGPGGPFDVNRAPTRSEALR